MLDKFINFVLKCIFLYPVLSLIDTTWFVLFGEELLTEFGITVTGGTFGKWFFIFYMLILVADLGKSTYHCIKGWLDGNSQKDEKEETHKAHR